MESLRTNGRRSKARRSMRQAVAAVVESLENRQLLAATIGTVTTLGGTLLRGYDHIAEMNAGVVFTEWYSGTMGITRGTPDTTVALHTFASGNEPDRLVSTGQRVFFTRGAGGTNELWSTDGTAAGTARIPASGLVSDIGAHLVWGNKLFFAGKDANGVVSPWISDGTAAGTFALIDTTFAFMEGTVIKPTVMDGYLYFVADHDGVTDLYQSDGTRAGTHVIATPGITRSIHAISNVGGKILLSDGFSLWTCTTAGATQKLGDYFGVGEMTPMNGVIYFSANLAFQGWQLHRTDGTIAGTSLVAPVGTGAGTFYLLRPTQNKLFFVAHTDGEGDEWWVTDGTLAGSHLITDLVPGTGSPNTAAFIQDQVAAYGGSIYFTHDESATGPELWTTDGTAAGTRLVQDLKPGTSGSLPTTITATTNGIYFSSTYIGNGALFKYSPETTVNAPPAGVISGTPSASVGTAPMTIQIHWTDAEGINTATLGNGDITVTLPDATTVSATYVSYTGAATDLVATYQIAAPVGGWNSTYSGTYQVTANAGQVSDTQGQTISTSALGSFDKTFAAASIAVTLTGTSVAENQPAGTAVGTLGVTGDGGTVTYTLVTGLGDADNASFTISGNQLLTGAILDFETKASYSIRVRASGSTGASDEQVFTISVTDVAEGVNQAPTNITLSNATIQENLAAGSVVGTLGATDSDAADLFTYTLVSGTGSDDNSSFTIVGDSLKSAAVFDYEARSVYSIRVRVTDQGGLSYEKTFAINVTDISETSNHAPTGLMLNGVWVAENLPAGTVVSTLGAIDPDPGDTFTFALVSGSGSADNGLFTVDGNQLKTAAVFDYETRSAYAIRLRVTDQGGLWKEAATTIRITDIAENETIGTFGMVDGKVVSLTLPFDGDLVTFKLSGGGTGVVKTNGSVALTGTTANSSLTISVKKGVGGDGYHTLTGITADGLLKSISAAKVFVHGDIVLNTSATAAGTSAVAIRLAGVQDGDIDTHGLPIRSLKLLDWQDTDGDADQVRTPWIGGITVSGRKDVATTPANELLAGDWEADVLTSSANAGTAIGTMKVAGSLAGAKIWADGAIRSISAKGAVSNSRIAAAAGVGAVSAAELRDSDVLVGVASNFSDHFADTAGDYANAAAKLGKLTVSGYRLAAGQVHPAYVTNSHISAAVYGTVSLANMPASTPLSPIIHVLSDTGVLKVKSLSAGMVAGGTWRGGVVTEPGQPERPNLVEQVV